MPVLVTSCVVVFVVGFSDSVRVTICVTMTVDAEPPIIVVSVFVMVSGPGLFVWVWITVFVEVGGACVADALGTPVDALVVNYEQRNISKKKKTYSPRLDKRSLVYSNRRQALLGTSPRQTDTCLHCRRSWSCLDSKQRGQRCYRRRMYRLFLRYSTY